MRRLYRIFSFWSVTLLTICLLASGALADNFDLTSSGIFNNPVGPATMVTTGVGTNSFSWGTGFNSPPSSLGFTGRTVSGTFETEFSFGTINYFNGTIEPNTQADSVNLVATLNFTTPSGIIQDFTFPLTLINTTNTGDPQASADYVLLGSAFDPNAHFNVGGIDYFLQFTRFGNVGPGGFITEVNQFHVLEGDSASADVFGILTANPVNSVPVPATSLLFGSGLLGLAGWRQFKKS